MISTRCLLYHIALESTNSHFLQAIVVKNPLIAQVARLMNPITEVEQG